jgi:hypothetical protein
VDAVLESAAGKGGVAGMAIEVVVFAVVPGRAKWVEVGTLILKALPMARTDGPSLRAETAL